MGINEIIARLEPYLGHWVVPVGLALLLFAWWARGEWNLLKSPGNPAFVARIDLLKRQPFVESYPCRIKALLAVLSRLFGEEGQAKRGSVADRLFTAQPWTALSFERVMFLAMLYPFLLLLLGWLLGAQGQLGNIVVLPEIGFIDRIPIGVVLVLGIYSLFKLLSMKGKMRFFWGVSTVLSYIFLVVKLFSIGAIPFTIAFAGGVSIAFVGVISIVCVGLIPVAFAVVVAFAAVVTIVVAVTFAVTFAVTAVVTAVVTIVVAVTAIYIIRKGFEYYHGKAQNAGKLSRFWFFGWIFLLVYVALAAWLLVRFGEADTLAVGFSLLLFLAFLPLFNAPLDWLSLGLTRGLLRSIIAPGHGWKRSFGYAVLDLVAAVVFLVLVALSSLLGLMLVNWLSQMAGGQAVIDLATLYQQITTDTWRENLWIWLLLGSTLMPTLIHFLVALFALIAVFPSRHAAQVAEKLQYALDEHKKLEKKGKKKDPAYLLAQQNIDVDIDARRFAAAYLVGRKTLVMGVWGLLAFIVFYVVFHFGTSSLEMFEKLMT